MAYVRTLQSAGGWAAGLPARSILGVCLWCVYLCVLQVACVVHLCSLLLLFVSMGKNIVLFWRLSRPHFFQLNNNIALLLLALNLEVKLGGVAIYDDKKYSKEKLGKTSFNDLARQPQASDIIYANKKIHEIIYMSLFFIISLAIAIEIVLANI